MSSLSPPRTHTDCKPLNSSCAEAALPKLGTTVPGRYCRASCTGCTGTFTRSNVNDGYWWDFLSVLWSCACREKETIPTQQLFKSQMLGWEGTVCSTGNYVLPLGGEKGRKPTKNYFLHDSSILKTILQASQNTPPWNHKVLWYSLRFAVLGIIYTVHENALLPKKQMRKSL